MTVRGSDGFGGLPLTSPHETPAAALGAGRPLLDKFFREKFSFFSSLVVFRI